MKYVGRSFLIRLLSLLCCALCGLALMACQEAEEGHQHLSNEDVGNGIIPMYRPDAPFVVADSMSTLADVDLANTKVGYSREFSDGNVIDYVVIDGLVVDGDIILATIEEFEAGLDAYEQALEEGNLEPSQLATQGAMAPESCLIGWFGYCHIWGVGRPWPNSRVYYERPTAAQGFTASEISNILRAIEIMDATDVRMIESSTARNRIRFNGNAGHGECNSRLGMVGGVQIINLGAWCASNVGIPLHEIGHAIGMVHEHQRSDRDAYVRPNYSNLKDIEWWRFFWKGPAQGNIVDKHDIEHQSAYDYFSIMHYPLDGYPSNWVHDRNKPALIVVGDEPRAYPGLPTCIRDIGQRCTLTPRDIESINKRY